MTRLRWVEGPLRAVPIKALFLVILSLMLPAVKSRGQEFSPYSDFQAMTLKQLETLEVKLTYVGPGQRAQPSIAFTSNSNKIDLTAFVPFRRPSIQYTNDDIRVRTFTVTAAELKAFIDAVGTLPNITAGGVAEDVYLSFALVNPPVGNKGFEAVLNPADSMSLFSQMRLALQADTVALSTLADMGCSLDLADPQRPTDVSSVVTVSISGLRLNRTTGRFVSTATLLNSSGSSISGPVSLVVVTGSNIQLFNRTGTTCVTVPAPVGSAYINAPLNANTLAAGASVKFTLEFDNPELKPITTTTQVLAGPGAR